MKRMLKELSWETVVLLMGLLALVAAVAVNPAGVGWMIWGGGE
jgi:hypothetical protein